MKEKENSNHVLLVGPALAVGIQMKGNVSIIDLLEEFEEFVVCGGCGVKVRLWGYHQLPLRDLEFSQ